MMEDKEIGKYWVRSQSDSMAPSLFIRFDIELLIRKLVEERAKWRFARGLGLTDMENEREALRDFGIDPKTWEK